MYTCNEIENKSTTTTTIQRHFWRVRRLAYFDIYGV